jgi:hypothetical protein
MMNSPVKLIIVKDQVPQLNNNTSKEDKSNTTTTTTATPLVNSTQLKAQAKRKNSVQRAAII